jgi:transposase-like protein
MGLIGHQYQNEDAAREWLEAKLWPDGPVCPHCGVVGEATKLQREEGSDFHGRKGLHVCRGCRGQFTITVGTVMEDSHIPLHKWLLAFHLMCSSKKGVSALQLQRELWGENPEKKDKRGRPRINGSYRTAWFMCHRIRWAMTQSPMAELLEKKCPAWSKSMRRMSADMIPANGECRSIQIRPRSSRFSNVAEMSGLFRSNVRRWQTSSRS